MNNQDAKTKTLTYSQLYKQSGVMYIRYHATIESKPNGQMKVGGSRPAFSKIMEQPDYNKDSGKYYSLLMGREYKPGRFSILLDFDNKVEGESMNGLDLAEMLDMDQYFAPKQHTPSGGLHYIFYVDAEQAKQVGGGMTGITYKGVKYNMDVKFKNGLCNCAPTKIEGYGSYMWENPTNLWDIPKLPDELFNLIRKPSEPKKAPAVAPVEPSTTTGATAKEMDDITKLCDCLALRQLDNYSSWIKIGMVLKKLGAPVSLWDDLSKMSKKYKPGECVKRWESFKSHYSYTMKSLIALAKEGNIDMLDSIRASLNSCKDVYDDKVQYPCTEIDTPFLLPKEPDGPMNQDQKKFKDLTEEFIRDAGKKSLILRSRYGSGKTTFMQRLIREHDPKRVLFITYRQTLARDIMKNFKQLGFKNYLDSYENPKVWDSPRLIVQLDSLMNLLYRNDDVMDGEAFELDYDLIVLDESESLMNHFDGKTMENKEISIWEFFDAILKHCKKMVLMDGDVSQRTMSFASSYGGYTYIYNKNNETNKVINLICNQAKWEAKLHRDLEGFYQSDPGFRVCIVSQSSGQALSLESDLGDRFPHLKIKRLVGIDSGMTKKQYFEDINKTLEDTNIFIYSPVIESGVDITIPVKKVYGVLCCKSNSQRAYMQMLARCRNVEDGNIDLCNDANLGINNNYNFWSYSEVLELNKAVVDLGVRKMVFTGSQVRLEEDIDTRRKNISVYNQVEELNKHPSLYINYLKVMAHSKGYGFNIDQSLPEVSTASKKDPRTNYKLQSIIDAPDITRDEYDELSLKKKQGLTTTDENFKVDKYFWKKMLVQDTLDPDLLVEFMYDINPLNNFLALIDIKNHKEENNLRSYKTVERVNTINKLINGLGWAHVMDKTKIKKDDLIDNWAENIVGNDAFKSKRINEIFNLTKSKRISGDMTARQIILYINTLLKPFGLVIRSDHQKYSIRQRMDLIGLIQRKNSKGRYYMDEHKLLNQVINDDMFLDEETGQIVKKKVVKPEYDTSQLDKDIYMD
jgi:hypothetical protein